MNDEISRTLSEPIGLNIDDQDLEQELASLLEDNIDQELQDIKVPKEKIQDPLPKPKDDFSELEQELGL